MSGQEDKKTFGISKLQALFRGKVTREGEYKRAKAGADILCPFLASPPSVVAAIVQLSNGQLDKDSLFYDLGCGDGQILTGVAAATGARCIGVDISDLLCSTAHRKALEAKVEALVQVRHGDLSSFSFDYAGDGIPAAVFAFLVPSCLQVLSQGLFKTLPKGVLLLLYKFPLPVEDGWIPITEVIVDDAVKVGSLARVFCYLV